ncbi:phosphatase PAP2 family protein [Candidatus Bathyarchaeota archaeon A05DMB-2]|jgi:undecaprenyl-diphosphatase|nr:phosphatase PAP2 family protein [Candidatus Bathyarchaeota archaeon A05DMB-2]
MSHQPRNQRITLIVSLLALIGFLLLAFSLSSFSAVNAGVKSWAVTIQANWFTPVAVAVSIVFDTYSLLLFSLAMATLLFYKKYIKQSVLLLGAMSGDALLVATSKALVYSPRPAKELIAETGNSFPSGHVTGIIVFAGLLTYFAWQVWRSSKAKTASGMFYVAITVVVGFDRIYLNVHWFSDVLGGLLLGTFWLTFSILVFQFLDNRQLVHWRF